MISVVIPTRDNQQVLGPCLAALAPALVAGLLREVIFADGGSTDDTEAIADATGARFLTAPPGEGPQLAAGIAAAKGPWALALRPGAVLGETWVRQAERHMATAPTLAAWFAPPPIAVSALRARLLGLPGHAAALLMPLSLWPPDGVLPESGNAIAALARRIGFRRVQAIPVAVLSPVSR